MKNEMLVSVSPVEPVCNKKGKITGWKVSAKYIVVTPMGRPSKLCFYSTRNKEYEFRDMFGLGYKLACKIRKKMSAKLKENENRG